jgi:alkylated DNA nucleotide flippase Atl1
VWGCVDWIAGGGVADYGTVCCVCPVASAGRQIFVIQLLRHRPECVSICAQRVFANIGAPGDDVLLTLQTSGAGLGRAARFGVRAHHQL